MTRVKTPEYTEILSIYTSTQLQLVLMGISFGIKPF